MTRLVLVGAMLVGACAFRRAPAPPTPADPAVAQRTLDVANGFVTVTLEVPHEPAGPKPVVIAFTDRRDELHDAGMITLQYKLHWEGLAGFAAPSRTPSDSGASPKRTYGHWLLESPDPERIGEKYFQLIDLQAGLIPKMLDALAGDPDVDMRRIGILGTSTSGFIALQAASGDRRIGVAIGVVTTGDYPCFLEHSTLGMEGAPLRLAPAYRRWLLARDPARQPERLVHAAVLMFNGRDDTTMPLPCVETTVDRLRRAYARAGVPERFRSVLVDGGHNIGAAAGDDARLWLRRWFDGGVVR